MYIHYDYTINVYSSRDILYWYLCVYIYTHTSTVYVCSAILWLNKKVPQLFGSNMNMWVSAQQRDGIGRPWKPHLAILAEKRGFSPSTNGESSHCLLRLLHQKRPGLDDTSLLEGLEQTVLSISPYWAFETKAPFGWKGYSKTNIIGSPVKNTRTRWTTIWTYIQQLKFETTNIPPTCHHRTAIVPPSYHQHDNQLNMLHAPGNII